MINELEELKKLSNEKDDIFEEYKLWLTERNKTGKNIISFKIYTKIRKSILARVDKS